MVDYATEVAPIFSGSCATPFCHDNATAQRGIDLSSYEGVMNSIGTGLCGGPPIIAGDAAGSNLVTKIDPSVNLCGGSQMPPGGMLTSAQITTIRDWIDQGAAPSDPTASSYFSSFILPIFQNSCTSGCHNSGALLSGLDLTSESALMNSIGDDCGNPVLPGDAAGSPLITKIDPDIAECAGNPMPLFDTPLERFQITTISAWIANLVGLPVELTSFSVQNNPEGVQLTWKTASESNNDGFDLQRSSNGSNWQTIAFVEGAGTSTTPNEYRYLDQHVQPGKTYYRLKQLDFDGSFQYSKVAVVENFGHQASLVISPNPVNDILNVSNGEGQISIYNSAGVKLREWEIQEPRARLDLSLLPPGCYIMTLLRPGGVMETSRIVK